MNGLRAILFDVFGTVVDWRGSLIGDFSAWGAACGLQVDWAGLVDAWRGAYGPSMNRVRNGEVPWANLDALQRASLAEIGPRFGLATPLSEAEVTYLVQGWHRLDPWPDAVAGLARLKRLFIVAPLSNGNVALLLNMARRAGLPWDMLFSTELFRSYKPDPQTYLGAVSLLGLAPGQVMMAAAHNADLHAAQALGLRTAFIARPTEFGPRQQTDVRAEGDWDLVVDGVGELAARLGA